MNDWKSILLATAEDDIIFLSSIGCSRETIQTVWDVVQDTINSGIIPTTGEDAERKFNLLGGVK